MNEAKTIELAVTKADLEELMNYYHKKTSKSNGDIIMIAQLNVALEEFKDESVALQAE